jgi:hypothetical protein
LGHVLDEYLKRCKNLAPGTQRTYAYQAELLKKTFGSLSPVKLTTDMLSDYRDLRETENVLNANGPGGGPPRLKRKVTQTSVNRELGLLRSAMRDMAKRRPKLIPALPYLPMESERNNFRQGFITEQEFAEKLYPQLPRHLKALGACAFFVGGRKGEWLRLDSE